MKNRIGDIANKSGGVIEYLEETTSTNDVARDKRFGHGDVVVAERQTAGRGQKGNRWDSDEGDNLTFSMVLNPRFLPAARQFLLSESVTLAISDTLQKYGIGSEIKWPNDIYVGDCKIAGVLIENDIRGNNLCRSIIGIGLNVNQTRFDPSLPNPTSMKLVSGDALDRAAVLGVLLENLRERYAALEAGVIDGLERDYHKRLYKWRVPSEYMSAGGDVFIGTIEYVGQSGELAVRHTDGSLHTYLFKEIEFVRCRRN